MRTSVTTRDVHVTYPDFSRDTMTITIPAGTEVMLVPKGAGLEFDIWAVRSEELLIRLSGNTHDPRYRYCRVPADAVLQPVANVDPDMELNRMGVPTLKRQGYTAGDVAAVAEFMDSLSAEELDELERDNKL